MLSKLNRLRKKKDFETVFKQGKIFRSGFLVLRVAKNNLEVNRFGFVVSKKISKKAVVRNKVRRRLSEAVKKEIVAKNGLDFIFIAQPGIEKKEFSQISEAVSGLLKK